MDGAAAHSLDRLANAHAARRRREPRAGRRPCGRRRQPALAALAWAWAAGTARVAEAVETGEPGEGGEAVEEPVVHDVSTEGEGWRSPTLWLTIVFIVSIGFGFVLSAGYRKHAVPACLKTPIGKQIYSIVPILFALVLMGFYFDAGLYLIMDGESGVWHVLIGFVTLVGGSYYSWVVYAWSLPDEASLIVLLVRGSASPASPCAN